ncbi:cell division regulator (septum placement) [[Clostridium] sordellii]|uniref:Probable septum site-determining protein MinC n=1 Tax=Paraclostridium sordellii TaxID=1505 RepID=A0A9P1L213_PARSO|nr:MULTISPECIES: septum site-determining protein MinC [Paeniclostridium]MDU5020604.1 septum site-determining protein MinC [Clostridiales bacterium]MDU7904798.1 septum site-determining protein MinC [Peptostreptococcaceae bacterium]AUN13257.1 septum site-determining protein MinC [Paeniclostridium sordellii]EPZ58410.1 septum site-determining protein MinC [[Clostridium] sordellii VPI 9048] [Paeniclostridium sordellii VPI 9048]MBS6023237.1 septum site-determining protein MinC [Paeniclostridium sord
MSFKASANDELVEFKGNKRGIVINVKKDASFEEIKQSIVDKIGASVGFFNGAKICSINYNHLTDVQLLQLKEDITSRFDIEFIEEEINIPYGSYETKYVNNMRSGDNVEFEGDIVVMADMKPGCQVMATGSVVVMGDISPGAKVIAYGNVVVMGRVQGFIHAGANGNKNAYIVANNLNPMVLKIAKYIAEAPEEDYIQTYDINPEIAFANNETIVIESYSTKKINR